MPETPAPDPVVAHAAITAAPRASAPANGDASKALWNIVRGCAVVELEQAVRDAMGDGLEARLEAKMQAFLASMPERVSKIEFHSGGVRLGEVTGHRHEAFARIARKAQMGFRNLMLVGPAGTGKSTLARQLAAGLGVPYGEMDCTPGTTESHMLGRAVPNIATGQNVYQESEFVKLYQSGGVFCFNESDWLDASIWGCIHEALANGHLFVPASGQTYQRHENFYIVCTANTYGKGATRQYLRNQLDAATLDRFTGAVVTVDYDEALEKSLVGAEVFRAVKAVRDRLTANSSREIWGMRVMLSVARMHANGVSLDDAILECAEGWSEQSKRHAGVA